MNVENDVETNGTNYKSARPTVAKACKDYYNTDLDNMAHNRVSMLFQLYL